ncbi:MAG TPA: cupin domain-containing protein [Anaeromyxobacter sp.]|nr:cupin domain-containing protein [Anaeromyxobacter sp.]
MERLVPPVAVPGPAQTPEPVVPHPPRVARKELLSVRLSPERPIASVEVQQVTLAAGEPVPLHLHPCPVVGVIRSGAIAFQIEGQPIQHLRPGDAFHEPAGIRVARFDAEGDGPATFTAFYLLGNGEEELIRLLDR